jgi:raffinose/stachyose/melibiose transport system permease protein
MRRRQSLIGLAFVGPAVVMLGLFMVVPLIRLVATSLTDWNGISDAPAWVGGENYVSLLQDGDAWDALVHNLVWLVLAAIPIVLGLILAVLLVGVRRGRGLYTTTFFLPYTLPIVVVGLAWVQIYHPVVGWLNAALDSVGLGHWALAWLGSQSTALPALVTAANWTGYGFCMLLFISGLSAIDPTLYDAAKVDGAGSFQAFWNVTLPGLANTMNLVVVVVFIATMRVFDIVFVTTDGGPMGSTEVLGTMVFRQIFNFQNVGYGSAVAVALSAVILAVAGTFLWLRERNGDAA